MTCSMMVAIQTFRDFIGEIVLEFVKMNLRSQLSDMDEY